MDLHVQASNVQYWRICLSLNHLMQWAVRVLDNEELARQPDVPLRSGTVRAVKVAK